MDPPRAFSSASNWTDNKESVSMDPPDAFASTYNNSLSPIARQHIQNLICCLDDTQAYPRCPSCYYDLMDRHDLITEPASIRFDRIGKIHVVRYESICLRKSDENDNVCTEDLLLVALLSWKRNPCGSVNFLPRSFVWALHTISGNDDDDETMDDDALHKAFQNSLPTSYIWSIFDKRKEAVKFVNEDTYCLPLHYAFSNYLSQHYTTAVARTKYFSDYLSRDYTPATATKSFLDYLSQEDGAALYSGISVRLVKRVIHRYPSALRRQDRRGNNPMHYFFKNASVKNDGVLELANWMVQKSSTTLKCLKTALFQTNVDGDTPLQCLIWRHGNNKGVWPPEILSAFLNNVVLLDHIRDNVDDDGSTAIQYSRDLLATALSIGNCTAIQALLDSANLCHNTDLLNWIVLELVLKSICKGEEMPSTKIVCRKQ